MSILKDPVLHLGVFLGTLVTWGSFAPVEVDPMSVSGSSIEVAPSPWTQEELTRKEAGRWARLDTPSRS